MAREYDIIKPIDFEKNTAIGMGIPLASSGSNFFQLNYTSLSQVKTNIKNLILTNKGERIMLPSYGSDINKAIFENFAGSDTDIFNVIRTAITEWLPEVNIINIDIIPDSVNEYLFLIQIEFSMEYNLQKVETLELTTRIQ